MFLSNLPKKYQTEPNVHLMVNYIKKDNEKLKNKVKKNKFSKFL
jgi:hypothetical protein